MTFSIQLNDQSMFVAIEINDESFNGMLAAKLEVAQSSGAQVAP